MATNTRSASAAAGDRSRTAVFSAFAGLTALAVLLQGLWAGLFVPAGEGGTYEESWVDVHAVGSIVALVFALVTTVVAVVTLRPRRELWIGAAVLTVLVVIEGILGGRISDGGSEASAAVHIPLALVIMSVAVWLPLRARYAGGR